MLYFICHVFQPFRFCSTSVNYYLGHDKSVEYSNILRLFIFIFILIYSYCLFLVCNEYCITVCTLSNQPKDYDYDLNRRTYGVNTLKLSRCDYFIF